MTGPTVVFLHGLARTGRSLDRLRGAVERAGHPTWSCSYPSRRMSIAELAVSVAAQIQAELGEREVIGVTHSMGGIVARHMGDRLRWRGLVMLAPPNAGSRLAASMVGNPVFRWFYGPAGSELGSTAPSWPPPPAPTAVIAGTRGFSIGNPVSWVRHFTAATPNDGTVAVDETRCDNLVDFATVDATHTWIMNHPEAVRLVLASVARFASA